MISELNLRDLIGVRRHEQGIGRQALTPIALCAGSIAYLPLNLTMHSTPI